MLDQKYVNSVPSDCNSLTQFPQGLVFKGGLQFPKLCVFGPNTTFGDFCRFQMSATFGPNTTFGEFCKFGANTTFSLTTAFGANNRLSASSWFDGKPTRRGQTIAKLAWPGADVTLLNLQEGLYIISKAGDTAFQGPMRGFMEHLGAHPSSYPSSALLGPAVEAQASIVFNQP